MARETTLPSLLSRVRDPSDEAAWREFDAQYRDLILRYCRARGLQIADAEDVRQISMTNLAKSLRSFKYESGRGRFRAYLGQVVRSAISRHFGRPESQARALVPIPTTSFDFLGPLPHGRGSGKGTQRLAAIEQNSMNLNGNGAR